MRDFYAFLPPDPQLIDLTEQLTKMAFVLTDLQCPPIQVCLYQLLLLILKNSAIPINIFVQFAEKACSPLPE